MQLKVKAIRQSTVGEKNYWWVTLEDDSKLMEVTKPAYKETDTINFDSANWIFVDKGKGKSYYRRKQGEEVSPSHAAQVQVGGDDERSRRIERQTGMKCLTRLLCAGKLDKHPELQKKLLDWLQEVT